jgi:Overcoming lysogenization defect protein-like, TOPRIM domain
MASDVGTRAVVLVEGISDRAALEALAARQGRDLEAEGVSIVAMGGAQAIGNALTRLGTELTRDSMELLGFYVCDRDLEDELVRAVGVAAMEEILDAQGELASFRTYQKQPAHRDRSPEDQIWGFMWNRKLRYARLLVEALDLDAMPRPLDRVLAHV